MNTHISYECAKKLKNFLKERAPEPMEHEYWWKRKWDCYNKNLKPILKQYDHEDRELS